MYRGGFLPASYIADEKHEVCPIWWVIFPIDAIKLVCAAQARVTGYTLALTCQAIASDASAGRGENLMMAYGTEQIVPPMEIGRIQGCGNADAMHLYRSGVSDRHVRRTKA
jgi:hypothetical protein